MSVRDVSDSFSYCSDLQSGKVDMELPPENYPQLPTQPNYHQETSTHQPSRSVQFHQLIKWNQGQPLSHNNWLNPYTAMYAAASSNYAITTDSRRIQGMETTIQYLRELLSKEITNNVKEKLNIDITKKELEVAQENNRQFHKQLQEALMEINELKAGNGEVNSALDNALAVQKELSANQRELQDAQSEIIIARKRISDLEAANMILESKLTELSKEENGLARLSSSESITGDDAQPSGEENDFAALKSQYGVLKYQLDATIEKKNTISNQFKELGKKYLYMVEYSGEQMYNEYGEKHTDFIEKLKTLDENSADETHCFMIKQTLDCIQGQLKLLEDYREDFRVTIELLMGRIDQEIAQVSDLSIRAPKPSLEIPLDTFDLLFQTIGPVGRRSE